MFDIAIIGGGLVGASLACALGPTNMRIALIEAVPFKSQQQPSYDDRILAIAQGSKRILDSINVWSEVDRMDITPIKTIHISDRGHFGATRLHHYKFGVDALGYTVSARVLGSVLVRKLEQSPLVTIMSPAKVIKAQVERNWVKLSIDEEPGEVISKLVVLADGSSSDMRSSLGFNDTTYGYNQSAGLTKVTPQFAHNHTAFERFTDTGPLAMLPTSENRYAVVWTALDEQVDDLLHCADNEFLGKLHYRFGDRLGTLSKLGTRRAHPLSFVKVNRPVRSRVVIVGNAAHTVHPVAGQGFNLGLRDISALAEVLNQAKSTELDVGAQEVMDRYWQWRKRDVNRVGQFTDGLIRTFANDSLPLVLLRDTALVAFDLIPSVQRFLVKRTMGLAGRLPRLARGLPLT